MKPAVRAYVILMMDKPYYSKNGLRWVMKPTCIYNIINQTGMLLRAAWVVVI
jgi:hypothetical protein